jgi:hypothetical protein
MMEITAVYWMAEGGVMYAEGGGENWKATGSPVEGWEIWRKTGEDEDGGWTFEKIDGDFSTLHFASRGVIEWIDARVAAK